jgi:TolB-like protein
MRGGSGTKKIDSLAVLPFVNATADANNEYLSDGLTESLIGTLSQVPDLKVMARSTVFRFKG